MFADFLSRNCRASPAEDVVVPASRSVMSLGEVVNRESGIAEEVLRLLRLSVACCRVQANGSDRAAEPASWRPDVVLGQELGDVLVRAYARARR